MAQPVVVQRLEEAVGAFATLEDEVEASKEPLDELVERGEELLDAVQESGGSAQQEIERASAGLSELRSRLEEAGQVASGGLDAVSQGAGSLQGVAVGALERVEQLLSEVGSAREALIAASSEGVEVSQAASDAIIAKVEELRKQMVDGLEASASAVGELRSAVGEARSRIAESRASWERALANLEQSAQDQAAAGMEQIRALLERFATSFVDGKNEIISAHNGVMSDLWNSLAGELPGEMETVLDGLAQTLASLDELRAEHAAAIQRACGDVSSLAQQVASELGGLSADLEQSSSQLPVGG